MNGFLVLLSHRLFDFKKFYEVDIPLIRPTYWPVTHKFISLFPNFVFKSTTCSMY